MLGQQHPLAERLDAPISYPNGEAPRPSLLRRRQEVAGICNRTEVCSSLMSDSAQIAGWSGEPHGNQAVELVASNELES